MSVDHSIFQPQHFCCCFLPRACAPTSAPARRLVRLRSTRPRRHFPFVFYGIFFIVVASCIFLPRVPSRREFDRRTRPRPTLGWCPAGAERVGPLSASRTDLAIRKKLIFCVINFDFSRVERNLRRKTRRKGRYIFNKFHQI